jgi:hypothetical protein
MIGQYLSNTNESATVSILQKFSELNKALHRKYTPNNKDVCFLLYSPSSRIAISREKKSKTLPPPFPRRNYRWKFRSMPSLQLQVLSSSSILEGTAFLSLQHRVLYSWKHTLQHQPKKKVSFETAGCEPTRPQRRSRFFCLLGQHHGIVSWGTSSINKMAPTLFCR